MLVQAYKMAASNLHEVRLNLRICQDLQMYPKDVWRSSHFVRLVSHSPNVPRVRLNLPNVFEVAILYV